MSYVRVHALELQKTNAETLYIYKMIRETHPHWRCDYTKLHLLSFEMKQAFFDQKQTHGNYYQRNRTLMQDIINTHFQ